MLNSFYQSMVGANPWVQIWIITMTELLADLNLQRFALGGVISQFHLFAGTILYIVLAMQLAFGFKTMGIGWLNGAWDGTSTLVSVLAGWALGEKLTGKQWIGLCLIIVGLYCL